VLIPDAAVDDYAAHIESVFLKQHRNPIELVSRSSAGASRVAEAVELLLELPSGRFSRVEMIRLLTHPALRARLKSMPRRGPDGARRWEYSLAPTTKT
jgi:exonuclease V gamma subunit